MPNATETIRGPVGAKILLDASQIFPDDPGAGTPALVEWEGETGTFWCAADTGELTDGTRLPLRVCQWLDGQYDTVNEWIEKQTERR